MASKTSAELRIDTDKESHSGVAADCLSCCTAPTVLIEGGADTEKAVYDIFEKTSKAITDLSAGV